MNMENLISWNFPNWVTVVLMVVIGFAVLSLASSLVKKSGVKIPLPSGMQNAPQPA